MALDLLGQVMDIDSWQPLAACRGRSGDANWFPEEHHAWDTKVKAAKAICAGCPVRVECLAYGLLMDEQRSQGIFGLTAKQRERIRGVMHRAGFAVNTRSCDQCGIRFPTRTRSAAVWCSDRCEKAAKRPSESGQEGRAVTAYGWGRSSWVPSR